MVVMGIEMPEIHPVSEQKITPSNQITNNQMKQNKQIRNRSEFKMIKHNG
jgi:hypothetical protein